jgi:hypothetical protein
MLSHTDQTVFLTLRISVHLRRLSTKTNVKILPTIWLISFSFLNVHVILYIFMIEEKDEQFMFPSIVTKQSFFLYCYKLFLEFLSSLTDLHVQKWHISLLHVWSLKQAGQCEELHRPSFAFLPWETKWSQQDYVILPGLFVLVLRWRTYMKFIDNEEPI